MGIRAGLNLKSAAVVAVIALATASNAGGQVTIEAQQGSSWGSALTVPVVETLTFRWKWNGAPRPTSPRWQITFTPPGSVNTPPVVKSVATTFPLEGQYATFQIAADAVPANAPGTFYVRIRGLNSFSDWIPVTVLRSGTVADRGGQRGSNRGSDRGGTRAEPVTSRPVEPESERQKATGVRVPAEPKRAGAAASDNMAGSLVGLPKPDKPKEAEFVVVDLTEVPLWIRLTQITCKDRQPEDGDDTDEVYAVVATVRAKPGDLQNSAISVWRTPVSTVTLCGHAKQSPRVILPSPSIPAWGPNDGALSPLRKPTEPREGSDVAIVVGLFERDGGVHPDIKLNGLLAKIRKDLNYPLNFSIAMTMHSVYDSQLKAADDWVGHGPETLKITQEDLHLARMGALVRKDVSIGTFGGGKGHYTIEFQIGKEGVDRQGPPIATCKDGTTWYAFIKTGACAGHAGVMQWLWESAGLTF